MQWNNKMLRRQKMMTKMMMQILKNNVLEGVEEINEFLGGKYL